MPFRTFRTIAFAATASGAALTLVLGGWVAPPAAAIGNANPATATPAGTATGTVTATSAGTGTTAGQASLQIRAQELAGEIEADGRTLDELDAAYNEAQIRLQSISAQQVTLRAGMARTTALVARAEKDLKEQALLAYMSGGAPVISYIPDKPGQDPSLTLSYAEIIAGGEKRAAANYRTDLVSLRSQSTALASTEQQAAATLAGIRSDQSQATAALASQQRALAQVKGQMAVLVAQVESQQQAAARTVQAQLDAGTGGSGTGPTSSGNQTPVAALTGTQTPVTPPTRNTPASSPATAPATSSPRPASPPTPAPPLPTPTAAVPTLTTAPTNASPTAPVSTSPATYPTSGPSSATGAIPSQAAGASQALAYARAQLGKPYQWAGAGPDSFDCSGLVMMAWLQAGIGFPHLAQDQYDMTTREPLSAALPGDLIFFGTPGNVYHVGIYIGNGEMIDAPETGQNVSVQSIYWNSLLGAGRVHS